MKRSRFLVSSATCQLCLAEKGGAMGISDCICRGVRGGSEKGGAMGISDRISRGYAPPEIF